MPLEVVSRKGRRNLYIRGTYKGQEVYECTGTSDPVKADDYRVHRENEIWQESLHGKKATKCFADAAASYLVEEPRSLSTIEYVEKLILVFGPTDLRTIDQESLKIAYRRILRNGENTSPATKIRAVITPLSAVLNHAAVMGWCAGATFKKPSVPKTATNFLLPHQVDSVIWCAAPYLQPLITFLFATGCRVSEAIELMDEKVDLRGARARVWQKQDTERQVDLTPRAVAALAPLVGDGGYIFRPELAKAPRGRERMKKGQKGRLIGASYRLDGKGGGQIKRSWNTACRNAGLPGQWRGWTPRGSKKLKREWVSDITPHDARHTWASWQYLIHRDLMQLLRDGGWDTLASVQRYTHLIPAIYRDEVIAWFEAGPVALKQANVP